MYFINYHSYLKFSINNNIFIKHIFNKNKDSYEDAIIYYEDFINYFL